MRDRPARPLGLYLHLPYCRAVCPYCDFAKTANFDDSLIDRYLDALSLHVELWLVSSLWPVAPQFTSVFIGGGTPSLVTSGYARLFKQLQPYLSPDCEITLETNPDDITRGSLEIWRDLGINRLSMGVQTFDPAGLAVLKRTHDATAARQAVKDALNVFHKVNIDLIYGWPAQTLGQWQTDLATALDLEVPHLSLYTLTYEPRTPLGRAFLRGGLPASIGHDDDLLAQFYEMACARLADQYEHEEVSNWSRPGHSCRHNWLYWQDAPYLAVGAGAHGYLNDGSDWGLRYAYDRNDRRFVKDAAAMSQLSVSTFGAAATGLGAVVDAERDAASWILEVIGSGLRTVAGIDLKHLEQRSGQKFQPNSLVSEALQSGVLTLDTTGRLTLVASEWFRETSWSVAVARSLGL